MDLPRASSLSPGDTSPSGSDDLSTVVRGPDRRLSEQRSLQPDLERLQTNLGDVELARIETYRLQHRSTVGSGTGITPREQWLPLGAGKPYPPSLPDPEQYIVEFTDANDPLHPQNWPLSKKIGISVTLAYTTFVSSFASAIFSSAVGEIGPHFHISTEVAILGVTLYVLGFASGPTVWAPASELIGRRWPICIGMFGYSIFTIATATSKDVQTLMLTRFFAGFFSASPSPSCLPPLRIYITTRQEVWLLPCLPWLCLWDRSPRHSSVASLHPVILAGDGLCTLPPSWVGWLLDFVFYF